MLRDCGRWQQVLELLENCDSGDPDSQLLLVRGLCHEALGSLHEAKVVASKLFAIDGKRAYALALEARIAWSAGDENLAEKMFGEAMALDDSCELAYLGLGTIACSQGRLKAGLESFEKAFLLSPLIRETAVAFHKAAISASDYERAESAFRTALQALPLHRRLRFILIDLLLRQLKYDQAMAEIETAMSDFGVDDGLLSAALSIRLRLGPLCISSVPGVPRSVSLCMIIKNEEEHLARCLHSAKPVVSEMIVVDTGSTDRSKEIAKAFGARVFEIAWEDDFSIARNFSLSKASGDWIFVLDADEMVSPKDYDKFRALIGRPSAEPCAYSIQTRNYTLHANTVGLRLNTGEYAEEGGIGWFPSDKVRFFRNDSRIRFINPVHELVEPALKAAGIPICSCDVPVHHFGKLHEAKTQEKTKAYRDLGKKKLKKNRRSLAALRELAIQSAQVGRHEDAIRLWKECLKLQPHSDEAQINLGSAYWNCKHYREAAHCAQKALRLNPASKEAKFNLAIAILMSGRAGEAQSILQGLLEEYRDYPAARFMLCVAGACVGDAGQVEAQIAKIQATALGPYLGESFLDVAKRFFSSSQLDYARLSLETAVAHNYGNAEIFSLLEDIRAAA
jgi:tetratricopeptide (TPR) repeat protein